AALRVILVELVLGVDAKLPREARIDDHKHLLALAGEVVGEAKQRHVVEPAVVVRDEVPAAILCIAVTGEKEDEEIAGPTEGAKALVCLRNALGVAVAVEQAGDADALEQFSALVLEGLGHVASVVDAALERRLRIRIDADAQDVTIRPPTLSPRRRR